jgi:ABC-type sugar transport system permease subunit
LEPILADIRTNIGGIFLKNTKLRIVWIIPNVFCYLMLFGLSMWVVANSEELREINRLSIYVIFMILLFLVSAFGSYRIWRWIKEGKM